MWKCRSLLSAQGIYNQMRYQSSTPANEGNKVTPKQTVPINETASLRVSAMHKPNTIDKWVLVWDKKYKSVSEIPAYVSCDKMERARNWARIKISTYLMIGTVIGCCIMIYSGKQAVARGESVTKANLEWHRKNKEEAMREKEKKELAAQQSQ